MVFECVRGITGFIVFSFTNPFLNVLGVQEAPLPPPPEAPLPPRPPRPPSLVHLWTSKNETLALFNSDFQTIPKFVELICHPKKVLFLTI